MAEFPKAALVLIAAHHPGYRADVIRQAVAAYEQLAERCVMDRTEWAIREADLRARLNAKVDPQPSEL